MVTRAAVKREAAFLAQAAGGKPVLGDESTFPPAVKRKHVSQSVSLSEQNTTSSKVGLKLGVALVAEPFKSENENSAVPVHAISLLQKSTGDHLDEADENLHPFPEPPIKKSSRKRKIGVVNGETIKGGWDQLPHNMGAIADQPTESITSSATSNPIPKMRTRTSRAKKVAKDVAIIKDEKGGDQGIEIKNEESLENTAQDDTRSKPKRGRKHSPQEKPQVTVNPNGVKIAQIVKDEVSNEFKQEGIESDDVGLKLKRKAKTAKSGISTKRIKRLEADESEFEVQKPKSKRSPRGSKKIDTSKDVQHQVDKLVEGNKDLQKAKKPKQNKYGITPGVSPYPGFLMPTIEACQEVNNLLSEVHGVVEQPKTIPPPSLEVTGCGEVPSVLDALIRTRLSAATTSTNSAYAFAGLVSKFGILQEGIGKGSVNWNKVREADVKDIEVAIKRGGLAAMKSKSIKEILNMVHEQNIARREAFIKEKESGEMVDVIGSESLQQGQKDLEIASADQEILSLQFMHGLTPDEAMNELTKYPGIGVKTASCVILFCLRRPSFAVDTHVFRLCKWLKWIPDNSTRDKAFSHCEVRVPNELKYSLHQLFIRHGKTCGRCRASTGETSETWKETVCPIEHLVERSSKRKIFKPAGEVKQKKKKKMGNQDSDSELSELDETLFDDGEEIAETSPEAETIEEDEQ